MTRPLKSCIFSICLVLNTIYGFSQSTSGLNHSFDEFIGSLAEEMEESEENASWLEELHELHENPVDINTAGKEELLSIPFLNEMAVTSLMEYRQKSGVIFSVRELTSVPGIGRDLAEKVSFFITAGNVKGLNFPDSARKKRGFHQWLARSTQSFPAAPEFLPQGDKPAAYQGSRQRLFTRYLYNRGTDFQAGLTADKDPGEPFFRDSNPWGFDFYSAHISFRLNKRISRIVIGDYSVRTGQGLLLWQGFSLGKTANILQVSKNSNQIRPYTSTDENRFFRGIAAILQMNKSKLMLFASSKKSDGNLVRDEDGSTIFTSLQNSGYHRTSYEIEDKKGVRHSVAGGNYQFFAPGFKAGATLLYENFQYPYVPGEQLYEKYLFRGTDNFNIGTEYRFVSGKYQLYGEWAVSKSGGEALLQGFEGRLHDQLILSMLFRHYGKKYHATWASAFGNNRKASNETGFYAGVKALPSSNVSVSAYADWFIMPWFSYSTAAPSVGTDLLLRADIKLTGNWSGYLMLRHKIRDFRIKKVNLYSNFTKDQKSLRMQAKYEINQRFALNWRLEQLFLGSEIKETGFFISQDVSWLSQKYPVSAVFRAAWYSTDSYNSRIYAYENDLLYSFSTYPFYGTGFRSYLDMKCTPFHNADLWFKVAHSMVFSRESTDLPEFKPEGKSKTEVKIQIRYKF